MPRVRAGRRRLRADAPRAGQLQPVRLVPHRGWDYAGQQAIADWTAATQAVTGDLRKVDSTLTGDALDRPAEQRITEVCAKQPTRTAGAI